MFVKNASCIKTLSRFCTMHADYVILHTLIKYQSTFFFSIWTNHRNRWAQSYTDKRYFLITIVLFFKKMSKKKFNVLFLAKKHPKISLFVNQFIIAIDFLQNDRRRGQVIRIASGCLHVSVVAQEEAAEAPLVWVEVTIRKLAGKLTGQFECKIDKKETNLNFNK